MEAIKEEIRSYWTGRVEKFEALRSDELRSDLRGRWLAEICRYLPEGKPLSILDIGTGTGFFCFLLAAEGHRMTGIDLTEEMIRGARRTQRTLGLPAEFFVMDAEAPRFAPGSFDAILTRNLTCFLPDLAAAYRNWRGLLRDGGVLINFDADYYYDPVERPLPAIHSHSDLTDSQRLAYRHISAEMKALQRPRPQWDVELLRSAGYREIRVDAQVAGRIYREFDRFYNPTPIFTVIARK